MLFRQILTILIAPIAFLSFLKLFSPAVFLGYFPTTAGVRLVRTVQLLEPSGAIASFHRPFDVQLSAVARRVLYFGLASLLVKF